MLKTTRITHTKRTYALIAKNITANTLSVPSIAGLGAPMY